MSVISDVTVPADDFTLGRALSGYPDIRVELERVVPLGERVIPYFWASNNTVEHIKETLRADPGVEEIAVIDSVESWALVRIDWVEEVDELIENLVDTDAHILEAIGADDEWTLQLRFPDHDALSAFYRRCDDRGITVQLDRVHRPGPPKEGVRSPVTDLQRDTLVGALEAGYYAVPRQVTLRGYAQELGISDTAASQRLRRGTAALITTTLLSPDDRRSMP